MKIYTLAGVPYVPVATTSGIVLRKAGKRSPAPGQLGLFDAQHQEGETRTNQAGHQEVLQGGRWHLADKPGPAQQQPAQPQQQQAQQPAQPQQSAPTMESLHTLHQQVAQTHGIAPSQNDPLAAIASESLINLNSPESAQFVQFLKQLKNPETFLELIDPEEASDKDLKQREAKAQHIVNLFDQFGVNESHEIWDLLDKVPGMLEANVPPEQPHFKPIFDLISQSAAGLEELQNYDLNPKSLALEYVQEYSKGELKSLRKDMERELASEADPKGRREYELSIKLADNVLENYPAISKELKKIRDTGDRMPDEFFDHDTVDGAKQNLATIQAAMTPSARKIGAILSPSKEIRDNEIINDDDELLPSEKADAARDHYWDTVAKLR
jgi:hypothetical protein